MSRGLFLFAVFSMLLGACADDPPGTACPAQAQGGLRWAYYPGYGCGPVPPALTKFP